jgi:Fe-S oxidoreductase
MMPHPSVVYISVAMPMDQPRCGLCDHPAGEDAKRVTLAAENRAWLEEWLRKRGHDPAPIIAQVEMGVWCARCAALPKEERRKLVPEMWARVRRRFGLPPREWPAE